MDYIYAKFHQILTTLLVDAYYGALHASRQDWVLKQLSRRITKPNRMVCSPSKDSDQPGHLPSLIRIFAVRSMGS